MPITPSSDPAQPSIRRQLWQAKRDHRHRLRTALAVALAFLSAVIAAAYFGVIRPRNEAPPMAEGAPVQETGAPPAAPRPEPRVEAAEWRLRTADGVSTLLRGLVREASAETRLVFRGTELVAEEGEVTLDMTASEAEVWLARRFSAAGIAVPSGPWTRVGETDRQLRVEGGWAVVISAPSEDRARLVMRHARQGPLPGSGAPDDP